MKNNYFYSALVAGGLTMAVALGFNLQGAEENSSPGQPAGAGLGFQRAGTLLGKDVTTAQGKVGTVRNLVVDLESGRILYVVVGLGEGKRVAVPPANFRVGSEGLMSKAGRQKLESSPEFTNQIDNDLGRASYVHSVYQQFGEPAWWAGAQGPDAGNFNNVHKVKELPGTRVVNVSDTPMGKVNNVIVDLPAGRVAYVTLDVDQSVGLGNDDLYALPPNALSLSSDKKHLVSNIDKDKLAGSPHFARDRWPGATDRSFASRVYQYYGKQAWFEINPNTGLQPTGRSSGNFDDRRTEGESSSGDQNWWWK